MATDRIRDLDVQLPASADPKRPVLQINEPPMQVYEQAVS